jgi:hypothetical protein
MMGRSEGSFFMVDYDANLPQNRHIYNSTRLKLRLPAWTMITKSSTGAMQATARDTLPVRFFMDAMVFMLFRNLGNACAHGANNP